MVFFHQTCNNNNNNNYDNNNSNNTLFSEGDALILVRQYLGEFKEDLELDFKLFFFMDSGSAYIVLEKSE